MKSSRSPRNAAKALRLVAYLEDFPASESVVSHGMSRVNGRLLACLKPELGAILINRAGFQWNDRDLAEPLRALKRPGPLLQRIVRRLAGPPGRTPSVPFAERFLLAAWLRFVFRIRPGDILFCPCGADPASAIRARRLATMLGLHSVLYLVDDFAESRRLAGHQALATPVAAELSDALARSRLLVISAGLGERIALHGAPPSHVIPLPYPEPPAVKSTQREAVEILFVGNTSHFYQQGLRDLAEAIDSINRKTSAGLRLRITLGKPEIVEKLLGAKAFVSCGHSGGSDGLMKDIAESLMCFLPYSFEDEYRVMVSTSFPSKLLDYMAAARCILCYAPPYATSARYFAEHGLPVVVSERSVELLEAAILAQLESRADHSPAYISALRREHNSGHIRSLLLEALAP